VLNSFDLQDIFRNITPTLNEDLLSWRNCALNVGWQGNTVMHNMSGAHRKLYMRCYQYCMK